MVRVGILVLLLVVAPSVARAKRVALVVGNSAYLHTTRLANPRHDAADIGAALKRKGFQVLEGFDLDKAAFDRAVRDFALALQGAEAGVFFYAGHGLQVAGHNYLVPVDSLLETASALDFETIRLELVHRVMERETQTNILFLDACRDNPLARNLARAMGTRSGAIGRGLAPVESGVGTLISFSTQPGNVALDGSGRNSPFAGALVKQIASNEDISSILITVRNDVMRATQRKQVPWEHSALTGRFYFSASTAGRTAPAEAQVISRSLALYKSLMQRILMEKLGGVVDPKERGRQNYYGSTSRRPKALAACIDWESSTPALLRHRGFGFSAKGSTEEVDERALRHCSQATGGCKCTIIDRNDTNALVLPNTWVERHRKALGGN